MKGGQTDDAIFEQVHGEFANAQRSWVSWYRNDLRKRGENPPEAVKPPKKEAEAAA
jgi:hypothetical protein